MQAEPSKNPAKKHCDYISIGHAISQDLINWKELSTALEPGAGNEWDNLALWTGSVIKKDDLYYMFYTGRNKNTNKKWIQKIGLATSNDLVNWENYDKNPISEANEKYYHIDNYKDKIGKVGAWRDPFVYYDNKSQKYYLLISARRKDRDKVYNGCIGIAESKNLLKWKILPPLLSPGVYNEMEVPQLIYYKEHYYLFFTTHAMDYEPNFAKKIGAHGGLHCYYTKELFGKYKPINSNGVVLDNEDEMYDVRLVEHKNNEFIAIGWLDKIPGPKFLGKLTKPFKLKINKDKISKI